MALGSNNMNDHAESQHLFLSQQDVDRLINEDAAETRISVMEKISSQYRHDEYSEQEARYAEQIFRVLAKDTELQVRKALAMQLKDTSHIPRDILMELIADHESVALPVIEHSVLLSDADLLQVIESSQNVDRINAVARRKEISQRVSHALVETQYPEVVSTLLDNKGANIHQQDYFTIMDRYNQDQSMMHQMAERMALPMPVVEQLIYAVSEQIAEKLKTHYDINLDESPSSSREALTLQFITKESSHEELAQTVHLMALQGRLTHSIILSSLCQGRMAFFEHALAELANIPHANARKLIRDRGKLGFEALYDKTNLPESTFHAVKTLLHVVLEFQEEENFEPGSAHFANQVISRLVAISEQQDIENLSYIIALVRQSVRH